MVSFVLHLDLNKAKVVVDSIAEEVLTRQKFSHRKKMTHYVKHFCISFQLKSLINANACLTARRVETWKIRLVSENFD